MRPLVRFSVNHPWSIVCATLAVTVLACFFIPRVKLQLDGRSLIPIGDPALEASDRAASLFGLRDVVVIGVASEETGIYSREALACIARLSRRLAEVDEIIPGSVTSLATMPRMFVEGGTIDTNPLLSDGSALDHALAERVRRETESLGLNDGVLVASDGRAAAIFAEVKPEADRGILLEKVRRVVEQEQGLGDYTLRLSGTALSQAVLGEAAAKDLARLIPAVLVVVGGVLILAFRHAAPAFISLAEIGTSLVWTVGIMGITGQSVFVTTLVMPVILLAIGVSDDVYALTHFSDEARRARGGDRREVIVSAFGGVARSIGITTVSTVIGLLSLAVTSLEPLRIFGTFGAVSIVFSSLFTFTLVPALIALLGPGMELRRPGRAVNRGHRMLRALEAISVAGPRRILLVAVVAACSATLLATRLRVDDSWVKNLPWTSDISQGDKELNRLFAGTITLDLLVDTGSRDGFLLPETLKAIGAVEDAISLLPAVGAVHTLYGDIARVSAALKGLSYADYRKALREGRAELGREEIEQALMLMESVRRTHITERLDGEYRRTRMTVFIRSADYERIHEVINTTSAAGLSLLRAGGVVTPFGDGWISYITVQLLVRGQIWSIALALLTDLALLSFLLKSVRSAAIAILPVVFSLIVVFAVLAATETPLGIANSMFAAIAIGLGLDFSIHLTSAYREGLTRGLASIDSLKHAFTATGPAIVTSASAITAGFSVLALSEVSPNMQLGLMICLSLLLCAAATLVLVPSIVMAGEKGMNTRAAFRHILLFAALGLSLSLSGCYSGSVALGSKGPAESAPTPSASPEAVKEERSAGPSLPDARWLVTQYNNRNFGSPGWRTVYLELVTDGSVTRAFTVINLWKRVGRETKTLFLLQEPRGLSGTNYLLLEDGPDSHALDMRVYLFLPSGQRQVLEIAPSNFNEGLLGSDFTYMDLRMKLPIRGYNYRVVREAVLHNERAWVLEAEPASEAVRRATSWAVAHLYLARDFQFMLGADYYSNPEDIADSSRASKRMRVERFEQRDGVWTATRINMFGPSNRYSVLSLKDARFMVSDIDSTMFMASSLPSLADRIQQGWTPAVFGRSAAR